MSNKIECEYCHGTGKENCKTCDGEGRINCPTCDGSGSSFIICPECHNGRVLDPRGADDDDTMPCPKCHGNYKIPNGKCSNCGGTGKVSCKSCSGTGKVTCGHCGGSGEFDISDLIDSVIVDDWYDPLAQDKIREDKLSEADIEMLKTAAEQGSGVACYICGLVEAGGDLRSSDGDSYFSKGAELGDVNALYAHACALPCEGMTPDVWREMMDCLARSAEKGNIHAAIDLAFYASEGYPNYEQVDKSDQNGLASDLDKVQKWCAELPKLAQHSCVNRNIVVKANALAKWLPKASNGDAAAMFELSKQYQVLSKSTGCAQDAFLGEGYLKAAAEKGNSDAVRMLAELSKNKDLGSAVAMLDNAAQGGDKAAKEQLNAIMQECMANKSRFDELKVIGNAGNVAVMKFLAAMYRDGKVCKKNTKLREERATEWFKKAADAGDGNAMLDLSIRYRDGKGCEKDINRSYVLAFEGRKNGGSKRRAMRLLGEYYRWGELGKPDYEKAIVLYTRAANAGYSGAMVALGKLYVEGLGVRKNLGEAKRLFEMAAAKKSKDANEELKKLPANVKANVKPVSGVTGVPSKGPLPDFVLEDYKLAKSGELWSADGKKKPSRESSKSATSTSTKKRWLFILIGLFFGLFGLHFLYARRKGWFTFYWLMVIANVVHMTVPAVANLVPALSDTPIFAMLAGLTFVGSIFFMKKDGDGNRM